MGELSVSCCKYHPGRRIVTFDCLNPAAPNRQKKRGPATKPHQPPSGKSRSFITRARIGKGLDGRDGTESYNTRATITKWIRRNRGTRKDTAKHDGGCNKTGRNSGLQPDTGPKSGTDETDCRSPKRRNQKAQSQVT